MPDFPVIDSHFHIYDPSRLPYSWIKRLKPELQRPHGIEEYRAASAGMVDRAVFMEFLVDRGSHIEEAAFGNSLVGVEAPIAAFVANAPVENGVAVARDLEKLAALPGVRAIRRILEDGRFDMALEADFIAGVKTVGQFGLPFEIGVRHWGLTYGVELVRRCPDVTFVLDHLATPGIKHQLREPWWSQVRELAAMPNVVAKVSGMMAGIEPGEWKKGDVIPYIRHAIECFGCDRLMYGSDWPMFTPLMSYAEWMDITDTAMAGRSAGEQQSFYRGTATRIYRL